VTYPFKKIQQIFPGLVSDLFGIKPRLRSHGDELPSPYAWQFSVELGGSWKHWRCQALTELWKVALGVQRNPQASAALQLIGGAVRQFTEASRF